MTNNLTTVVPIVLFFVVGLVLRRTKFAAPTDGQFILRLLFFVALPSLTVVKVSQAELSAEKVWLPVACILVNLTLLAVAWLAGGRQRLSNDRLGALVLGAMILNNAFLIPFVLAGYGDDALTDLVLFDLGNALVVSIIAFPLAYRFGGQDADLRAGVRRAFTAPMTWAIIVGVALNAADKELPTVLERFFTPLGLLAGPLILIALGILFQPSLSDFGHTGATVLLRMGGGLLVGFGVVALFGFTGDTRTVVLLAASSPIGFTALTFSSLADLDAVASARAVSASLLLGIIAVPIVIALTT